MVTTNDFELLSEDIFRGTIDGEHKYARILIRRIQHVGEFGNYELQEDNTIKFDTLEGAMTCIKYMRDEDLRGKHYVFKTQAECEKFWKALMEEMKEFTYYNSQGEFSDIVNIDATNLEIPIEFCVRPDRLIWHLCSKVLIKLQTDEINGN